MSTITKKQYLTHRARLAEEMAALQSRLRFMEQNTTGPWSMDESEEYNDLADYESTLNSQQRALEDEWDTRHWTAADWQSQKLIALNMD